MNNNNKYTNNRICAYCKGEINSVHGARKYCPEKNEKKDFCKIKARQEKESLNLPNVLDNEYFKIDRIQKIRITNARIIQNFLNKEQRSIIQKNEFLLTGFQLDIYDELKFTDSVCIYYICDVKYCILGNQVHLAKNNTIPNQTQHTA